MHYPILFGLIAAIYTEGKTMHKDMYLVDGSIIHHLSPYWNYRQECWRYDYCKREKNTFVMVFGSHASLDAKNAESLKTYLANKTSEEWTTKACQFFVPCHYRIFSYGILQNERTQIRMYGRKLDMIADSVLGYKTIGTGILMAVKAPKSIVRGHVIELATMSELDETDRLELSYDRIEVTTKNGLSAWMYVEPSEDKNDLWSNPYYW